MRASQLFIIIAFWSKVLLLVSSCASYTSAAEKIKFSDGDAIKIKFYMFNMGEATTYYVYELNQEGFSVYLRNITSTDYMATYERKNLAENTKIYIYLYIGEWNCDIKIVAELAKEKNYREAAPKNSCLTSEGCLIQVDWQNKCTETPRVLAADTTRTELHQIHKTVTVYESLAHNNKAENISFTCQEGDNVTISCRTDFKTLKVKWIQKKDNENTIMDVTTTDKLLSSINLIISRFDHGTTIQCILYDPDNVSGRYATTYSSDYIFIVVDYGKNKNVFETTTAVSRDIVSYHDFTKLICSGFYYKRWIKLSREGLLEKSLWRETQFDTKSLNLTLPLTLNEKDNNTYYVCISQSLIYTKQFHKREVLRIVHLVYNATEYHEVSHLLEIAGGAGGLAVVLMLTTLILFICSKKKTHGPAPLDVETYACPTTVQYVDLQKMSSNSRRCVNKDDTPYALIVGVLEPNSR